MNDRPKVDFKKGRLYLIENLDSGFRFLGRYLGIKQFSDNHAKWMAQDIYYLFEPLAVSGPILELCTLKYYDMYIFEWAQFPYLYETIEVKPEDLPLYVSADRHWPAYEEAIKQL